MNHGKQTTGVTQPNLGEIGVRFSPTKKILKIRRKVQVSQWKKCGHMGTYLKAHRNVGRTIRVCV